ncbi:MAG: hypothetical protein WCO52_02195 [bacterium]
MKSWKMGAFALGIGLTAVSMFLTPTARAADDVSTNAVAATMTTPPPLPPVIQAFLGTTVSPEPNKSMGVPVASGDTTAKFPLMFKLRLGGSDFAASQYVVYAQLMAAVKNSAGAITGWTPVPGARITASNVPAAPGMVSTWKQAYANAWNAPDNTYKWTLTVICGVALAPIDSGWMVKTTVPPAPTSATIPQVG